MITVLDTSNTGIIAHIMLAPILFLFLTGYLSKCSPLRAMIMQVVVFISVPIEYTKKPASSSAPSHLESPPFKISIDKDLLMT